jgi:hypothetical protein
MCFQANARNLSGFLGFLLKNKSSIYKQPVCFRLIKKILQRKVIAKMLEEKLRKVKEGVVRSLEQREMKQNTYFQTVHELLMAEGLTKSKYDQGTPYLAITTGVRLMDKIGAKNHSGIEETYVALKGKPLSPEVQQDVQNLSDLVKNARKYVAEKIEGKEVREKEFNEMISSYVSSQTAIPISDNRKIAGATGWVMGSLQREFKVAAEPVKYDGIDEKELYKIIDKL